MPYKQLLCHPYIHSNLENFYIYLSPLIFKQIYLNLLIILVQVSSNAMSSKKTPRHGYFGLFMYTYVARTQAV